MKYAIVTGARDADEVSAYMPSNYHVLGERDPNAGSRFRDLEVLIGGQDDSGWTLADYVIPRLGSGSMGAREVTEQDLYEAAEFDLAGINLRSSRDEENDAGEQAHEAWLPDEEARGELAMTPISLPCWDCTREAGLPVLDEAKAIRRKVVKVGAVVDKDDPTQTYKLACGHTTI